MLLLKINDFTSLSLSHPLSLYVYIYTYVYIYIYIYKYIFFFLFVHLCFIPRSKAKPAKGPELFAIANETNRESM